MNVARFDTAPGALVRCACCDANVNYFADDGSFYSEDGEVLYRCERCTPEAIARAAASAARSAEITAYHDAKHELWIAGKPHDHDAVTAALQSAGEMSVGGLQRKQAA